MKAEKINLSERLQKVLAQNGLGSRRQIEKAIDNQQIKINQTSAVLGQRVHNGDRIFWKNRTWMVTLKTLDTKVLMYHKPVGEIVSKRDPQGRPTVFDKLPKLKGEKWVNVGRLDINTSGLILFTTDGTLANHMMHPSANIDREYLCRIYGTVTEQKIQNLKNGVILDDGSASFSDIQAIESDSNSNQWFHVVIMEGKNREVRRLWESQDVKVSRLKRVRYGGVFLSKKLTAGKSQILNNKELNLLFTDINYTPANLKLAITACKK